MSMNLDKTAISLRNLIVNSGDECYYAPGVFDAFTAQIAKSIGFSVISVTGNGVSAALLGKPDIGMLSLNDLVDQTRRIVMATGMPVIADGEAGYGGELMVIRTVQEFEATGAAAIHFEDQTIEKKCAFIKGPKRLATIEEFVRKIRAAIWARSSEDFYIIARCDAKADLGLAEAIRRCCCYAEAGADIVMIPDLHSLEEIKALADAVSVPVMINNNEEGPLSKFHLSDFGKAGAKIVISPACIRNAVCWNVKNVLTALKKDGSTSGVADYMVSADEYHEFLNLPFWLEVPNKY